MDRETDVQRNVTVIQHFSSWDQKHLKNSVYLRKKQLLQQMQGLVTPAQHTLSAGASAHGLIFFFNLRLIRGKDSGIDIWLRSRLTLCFALPMSMK